MLSSRRAARRGAPPAPRQRRPRRAARRFPHLFVYSSFGHTRCWDSLPRLAAALDGVAADDAAGYASQNRSHRGRWAHRLMSLAHAQGCPVSRVGGRAWALETASVPDSTGLPSARCTVGRQVPGAHLPSPGLTVCGLAIQVLSRPLGLSLDPGDGYLLVSCRSLDQLDWARSRALQLPGYALCC